MTDRFVQQQLRNARSRADGIQDNLRRNLSDINKLEREIQRASRQVDAYTLQQHLRRQIAEKKRGIRSLENELQRTKNEIQNLSAALR